MAKFIYIGDPQGPEQVTFRGMVFTRNGPPVSVTDAAAIAKLRGNRLFKRAVVRRNRKAADNKADHPKETS